MPGKRITGSKRLKTLTALVALAALVVIAIIHGLIGVPDTLFSDSAAAGSADNDVRQIRDDVGFCWNYPSMSVLVNYLETLEKESFSSDGLVAAISPHDDYLYAGRVYYPLFKILRSKEVVIFGVTHAAPKQEVENLDKVVILDEFRYWPGVLHPIEVSPLRDYIKANIEKKDLVVSNRAHELEHSIEALLPFLQYFNPDAKITPIMVAPMPFDRMDELSTELAGIIADYMRENNLVLGRDIFFLISADANHYGKDFNNTPFGNGGEETWEKALTFDRQLIDLYLTGVPDARKIKSLTEELWGETYLDYRSSYWCGKYSIPFGLLTAQKVVKLETGSELYGRLFRFSDTYSEGVLPLKKTGMGTTAPFSLRHWVSFFSMGYYLQKPGHWREQ
jgi:AmmeMemoRadiSam system protein B